MRGRVGRGEVTECGVAPVLVIEHDNVLALRKLRKGRGDGIEALGRDV